MLIKAKKQIEEFKEEAEEKANEVNDFIARLMKPKWLGLGITLLPIIFRMAKGRFTRNRKRLFFG
jgi:hypothetical protein